MNELERRFKAHVEKTFGPCKVVKPEHMAGIDEVPCQPWRDMPDSIPNSRGGRTRIKQKGDT